MNMFSDKVEFSMSPVKWGGLRKPPILGFKKWFTVRNYLPHMI